MHLTDDWAWPHLDNHQQPPLSAGMSDLIHSHLEGISGYSGFGRLEMRVNVLEVQGYKEFALQT